MSGLYHFTDKEREFFEKMPFNMAIYQTVNGKTSTVLVSDAMCSFYGMPREDVILSLNTSMFRFVHPDDAPRIAYAGTQFQKGLADYSVRYRAQLRGMDHYHEIHCIGEKRKMPDGTLLAFFLYMDVEATQEDDREAIEMFNDFRKDIVYHDELTGLGNKMYLMTFGMDETARICNEGNTPAAVFMNITSLKAYNAQYGKQAGDDLLKGLAGLLKQFFPDALSIRYVDDRFIMLCRAKDLLEQLGKMEEEFRKLRKGGNCRLIYGIYFPVPDKDDINTIIERSSYALKQIGSDTRINWSVYDTDMDQEYWHEQYVLNCLDQAMEQNWIIPYYQPVYDNRTGNLYGLEALARWIDPQKGMLAPYRFIPVLEKYHLTWKLDWHMLCCVLHDLRRLQDAGRKLHPISVNIAREDLEREHAIEHILKLVDESGIERRYIVFEITERDLAVDDARFREAIECLRREGFQTWVDDFGSGYSSLNVMHEYHFDLIKLDMQFLQTLDENKEVNHVIMASVVHAAHQLGIETLTEGVETKDHLAFLKEIHCDLSQGYLFSKPKPLSELQDVL